MGTLADQNIIRRKGLKWVIVLGVLFGLFRLVVQFPAEATAAEIVGAVVGATLGGVVFLGILVFSARIIIIPLARGYQTMKSGKDTKS